MNLHVQIKKQTSKCFKLLPLFFQKVSENDLFLKFVEMTHTQEKHELALNNLCRICGGVTLTLKEKKAYKTPYAVNDVLARDIAFVCDITVSRESNFSKNVCHKCYAKLQFSKKQASTVSKQTLITLINNANFLWQPFDELIPEEDCAVCNRRKHCLRGASVSKSKPPFLPNPTPESHANDIIHAPISSPSQSDSTKSGNLFDISCDSEPFESTSNSNASMFTCSISFKPPL